VSSNLGSIETAWAVGYSSRDWSCGERKRDGVEFCADFIVSAAAARSILVGGGKTSRTETMVEQCQRHSKPI